MDHSIEPDTELVTRGKILQRFRRFVVGIIGVAAVPFLLLGVAAAGIGFLVWMLYFFVLVLFGGSNQSGTLLAFLLWSGFSLVLARWLAKHLPGDGNGGAAAMRFVLIWMAVLWLGFYVSSAIPGLQSLFW